MAYGFVVGALCLFLALRRGGSGSGPGVDVGRVLNVLGAHAVGISGGSRVPRLRAEATLLFG